MFLKLLSRVLALLIVAPALWLVSTKLLGWSYPFLSWYVPVFVLGFIGSFAIDGIVWLWRHLTKRAVDGAYCTCQHEDNLIGASHQPSCPFSTPRN
jgi:hypothetical protein